FPLCKIERPVRARSAQHKKETVMTRLSRLRATLLGLVPAALVAASSNAAFAQSVSFQGQTYVNKGLVGVARVPSNATDKIGDTVSLGSGMTVAPGSWHMRRDGSYAGTFLMLPDRGWNTQGTVDYPGRFHRYDVVLNPYYGAGPTAQGNLVMT